MSKFIKTFILGLATLIEIGIFANPVRAGDDFNLELMSPSWDVIYGGETKIAELKIINNTGSLLEGEATFSCWYEEEPFQGNLVVISPSFGLSDNHSEWINGSVIFSDFEISEGETLTTLEMKTHPALMPGQYSFTIAIKGTTEKEEYITPSVIVGGGGWMTPVVSPVILEETILTTNIEEHSVVIEWDTSYLSTSRVIYSKYDENHILDLSDNTDVPPLYGYIHTTQEQNNDPKVLTHSVFIDGLESGTTYYFRCISHASPDSISQEHSFTTLGVAGEVIEDEDIVVDDQKDTETTSEAEGEVIGEVDEHTTSEQGALEDEIGDREDIISQIEEKIDEAKESSTEIGQRMLASLGMIGEKIVSSWFLKILLIVLLIFLIYLFLKKRKKDNN